MSCGVAFQRSSCCLVLMGIIMSLACETNRRANCIRCWYLHTDHVKCWQYQISCDYEFTYYTKNGTRCKSTKEKCMHHTSAVVGNNGFLSKNSTNMQPTDQISTGSVWHQEATQGVCEQLEMMSPFHIPVTGTIKRWHDLLKLHLQWTALQGKKLWTLTT